ncbi:MAG: hypothetical protein M3P44_17075 [Actinomycetota bacterium]|nr:hypothetical protein [Actinomycetota bacterium]
MLPIRIDGPSRGAELRGRELALGAPTVDVTVTGSADPGAVVHVAVGCRSRACVRFVFTDRAGRWEARLRPPLKARVRSVTVVAGYALGSGADARRTLPVRWPRRRTAAKSGTKPRPTSQSPAAPLPSPAPGSGAARDLVVIGDSLAVGIGAALPADLPGWRVQVDGRVGRPLAEGLAVMAERPIAPDGSMVLAVSLFTNDDPTHTAQLRAAVSIALGRVGARGCVVWGTIARPPLNGVSYQAANAVLERAAAADPRLRLVPWAQATAQRPALLGPDGVHPTPQGYQLLARLYADAAASCP